MGKKVSKNKVDPDDFLSVCSSLKAKGLGRPAAARLLNITMKTLYNRLRALNTTWKALNKTVVEKKVTKTRNGKKVSEKVVKKEIVPEKVKAKIVHPRVYNEISENSYKRLLLQILNAVEDEDKDLLKTKTDILKEMRAYLDKTDSLEKQTDEDNMDEILSKGIEIANRLRENRKATQVQQ